MVELYLHAPTRIHYMIIKPRDKCLIKDIYLLDALWNCQTEADRQLVVTQQNFPFASSETLNMFCAFGVAFFFLPTTRRKMSQNFKNVIPTLKYEILFERQN
jgi:hypothetical protein